MIRACTRFLICLVTLSGCSRVPSGLRTPNRGTQLFVLIEQRGGATQVVAMDEPSRWIIQEGNRYNPTYDFISAESRPTAAGCKLSFIRYVMKEDYIPREEHAQFVFPYAEQPRYRFFDYGYITGFYRNSVHDIDDREFFPRQSSNQAMELTASRRTARPPYTEDDVRAFVQPGTPREAIIKRFGEPLADEKNPKFEGGYTGVDEIIYYFLPSFTQPRKRPPSKDWVFSGFQVRLKNGKAVEWMATHSD